MSLIQTIETYEYGQVIFAIIGYKKRRLEFSPKEFSPKGIFAEGIFAEGIFAERKFRRTEFSPNGNFVERKFRRTEFLPSKFSSNGILAENFPKV